MKTRIIGISNSVQTPEEAAAGRRLMTFGCRWQTALYMLQTNGGQERCSQGDPKEKWKRAGIINDAKRHTAALVCFTKRAGGFIFFSWCTVSHLTRLLNHITEVRIRAAAGNDTMLLTAKPASFRLGSGLTYDIIPSVTYSQEAGSRFLQPLTHFWGRMVMVFPRMCVWNCHMMRKKLCFSVFGYDAGLQTGGKCLDNFRGNLNWGIFGNISICTIMNIDILFCPQREADIHAK